MTEFSGLVVGDAYRKYRHDVFFYVYGRIGRKEDAEDLVQDTFLRLWSAGRPLSEDTLKRLLYTIARNLVTDYLRRFYKRQEVMEYVGGAEESFCAGTESRVIMDELRCLLWRKLSELPVRRREVYMQSHFRGRSSADIAEKMNLSKRTVENHLLAGRKEIRTYMKQFL